MSIVNFLATNNYIVVNKTMIKKLGIDAAILLGELCNEFVCAQEQGDLTDDGYFCATVELIENNTGLKEKRQREALNLMCDNGILDIDIRTIPAKRFIRINEEIITEIMGGTSSVKSAEQVPSNPPNKFRQNGVTEEVTQEETAEKAPKIKFRQNDGTSSAEPLYNSYIYNNTIDNNIYNNNNINKRNIKNLYFALGEEAETKQKKKTALDKCLEAINNSKLPNSVLLAFEKYYKHRAEMFYSFHSKDARKSKYTLSMDRCVGLVEKLYKYLSSHTEHDCILAIQKAIDNDWATIVLEDKQQFSTPQNQPPIPKDWEEEQERRRQEHMRLIELAERGEIPVF